MSLDVRPLSTRSIVLSLLLGYDGGELSARALVRAGETLGVTSNAMRVTLSRMVATGDLLRSEGRYVLPDRLQDRQRRQAAALAAEPGSWTGDWLVLVLTQAAPTKAERARRRQALLDLRLATPRDGVWMRPDNLDTDLASLDLDEGCLVLRSRVGGPGWAESAALSERLWGLASWSGAARDLLATLSVDLHPSKQMAVAATMLRHLERDPILPEVLLPHDWPGRQLREAYGRYRTELIAHHTAVLQAASA